MNIWEGQRVKLRAAKESDWDDLFRWHQDTEFQRHGERVTFPMTVEANRKLFEDRSARSAENHMYQFEIEALQTGEHVGYIVSHSCNRLYGTFSYGIAIGPEYQRNGYASDAVIILLRYFFQELRYQKVVAGAYGFNQPSLKLHERLGFQVEGRLRRMIYTNGHYYDEVLFGMTIEEFREKYGEPR